jgi:glycosyltransferase involved in cell wall biosynthesis
LRTVDRLALALLVDGTAPRPEAEDRDHVEELVGAQTSSKEVLEGRMKYEKPISVALCTYNGDKFLSELLSSLEKQTILPGELVVCDDGSTDKTISILTEFSLKSLFPVRIRLNKERLGYRSNFRLAASLCLFDIIAFCDQDDIWDARKLEVCRSYFANSNVYLVYHQATVCNSIGTSTNEHVYKTTESDEPAMILSDPWFAPLGFTEVFRSSLLSFNPALLLSDPWDGGVVSHDHLVYLSALSKGQVVFIKDSLTLYRQHGGNVAGVRPRFDLGSKIEYLCRNRAKDYLNRAKAAKERGQLIQDQLAAEDLGLPFITPGVVKKYKRLGHLYALRARLYESKILRCRIKLYVKLLRERAYSSRDLWLMPIRNRIRDLVLGVVLNSWLR